MILVALIGMLFYRVAQKRNLIPWLWAVIGAVSYFAGQFFAGIFLALTDPSVLEGSETDLIVPALVGGLITVVVMYGVMELVANKKNKRKDFAEDQVLDDGMS
jgi:hypothetical protein